MFYIYTNSDLTIISSYNIKQKTGSANSRFQSDLLFHIDILNALKRVDYKCFYCNQLLKPKNWHLDHFYSKAMGGKNIPSNLAPSCKWCNMMKGAMDGHSFLIRCKKIYMKNLDFELHHEKIKGQTIKLKDR